MVIIPVSFLSNALNASCKLNNGRRDNLCLIISVLTSISIANLNILLNIEMVSMEKTYKYKLVFRS